MSGFSYAYSINKKPADLAAFQAYLQNGSANVVGVRYDDVSATIKVDFPFTINQSDKAILDSIVAAYDGYEPVVVEVKLKQEYIKTQGNYQIQGLTINTPANSTSTSNFSWRYPISIMATKVHVPNKCDGDIMDGKIALPIPIGVTTQPIAPGDTSLHVSPTVLQYMNIGYVLKVSDGVNTDVVNEVYEIDQQGAVISVCCPFTHGFAPGAAVYFERTVVKNLVLYDGMHMTLGDSTGGIPLPPDIPITVTYQNKHDYDVSLTFYIEHLY